MSEVATSFIVMSFIPAPSWCPEYALYLTSEMWVTNEARGGFVLTTKRFTAEWTWVLSVWSGLDFQMLSSCTLRWINERSWIVWPLFPSLMKLVLIKAAPSARETFNCNHKLIISLSQLVCFVWSLSRLRGSWELSRSPLSFPYLNLITHFMYKLTQNNNVIMKMRVV